MIYIDLTVMLDFILTMNSGRGLCSSNKLSYKRCALSMGMPKKYKNGHYALA